MNKKGIDLTGQKFGRWTVIKLERKHKHRHWKWLCRCECGKEKKVEQSDLTTGHSKGCKSCQVGRIKTTHGWSQKRLYRIWKNIINRCENPKKTFYENYGGRGIKICSEWRKDFVAFKDWALANGYKNDLTIDRIDNDGDYKPENCQFLTRSENTRKQFRDKKAA